MKKLWTAGAVLMSLFSEASGHMEMYYPAPIKSRYNRYYDYWNVDYSYNDPLGTYPCKGYHEEEPENSVETFEAGKTYTLSLMGKAKHHGGSCQLSLSYDRGETFTVIKSIIGGCPLELDYDFEIPQSAPQGQALFAWSWISRSGNRDFYHNCAWVNIENPNPNATELEGPPIFLAQLPGYCTVPEGREFIYPDPGPNVEYGGDSKHYSPVCDYNDHLNDINDTVFFDYDENEDDDVDGIYWGNTPNSPQQETDEPDDNDDEEVDKEENDKLQEEHQLIDNPPSQ
ncbi:hypothetical protein TRICI_004197 [Trichomonascus ciferrii]|uniref:Chitin-binding type-4 domain-containing protein n=1 Tax=Trichomonascus ciferrii TaxID=44093 RepID=A0A642V1F8_9ASCO|nr:hypothetical protein TRICI_004197 [Trichomonascus ciferrii]